MVAAIEGKAASDQVKFWISLRCDIYTELVMVTVSIVGFAAWYHSKTNKPEPWVPQGLDDTLEKGFGFLPWGKTLYEHLIRPLFLYPVYAAIAVGLILVFWAVSRHARIRLRRTFTQFWRSRLPAPGW